MINKPLCKGGHLHLVLIGVSILFTVLGVAYTLIIVPLKDTDNAYNVSISSNIKRLNDIDNKIHSLEDWRNYENGNVKSIYDSSIKLVELDNKLTDLSRHLLEIDKILGNVDAQGPRAVTILQQTVLSMQDAIKSLQAQIESIKLTLDSMRVEFYKFHDGDGRSKHQGP